MNVSFENPRKGAFTPLLVLGVGVMLLGLVLSLNALPEFRNSRVLEFVKNLWPLILVFMGIAKFRQSEGQRRRGGYALIIGGLFALVMVFGHGHFDALIGPAILLAVGIFIVLHALKRYRGVPIELKQSGGFLQGLAILSGFRHRSDGAVFRGGELTAIFGGLEVDLRNAVLEGSSVRLDICAIFGGGRLWIPEGWDLSIQTTAIAGSVEDKTAPRPLDGGARPRLVITGLVLFGGLEIRS